MPSLEDSLAIATIEGGAQRAIADPSYEANTGMFGGWTSALLLKAVLQQPGQQGSASTMTVNFIDRVIPGEPLKLETHSLGGGRSLTHWRCDLHREATNQLLATATVVMANRRETEQACDFSMPVAPPPVELPLFRPPGTFGQRVDTRGSPGGPAFNRPDMRSLAWIREDSGRLVDTVQIAFLSDVYAPRVFHISNGPRPSSTVRLSLNFLAGPDELAAIGDDYILAEVEGTRIEQAQAGSQSRLWSPQGTLLATSDQLCWFR